MIPESLANDFHQDSFFSAPVKLTIKNLFPRTEIQLSLGHRNDNLTPHDRSFQMSIAVIFTGIIMPIKIKGLMRSKLFEPTLKVMMKPGFIIIDKDRRGDVHGIAQQKSLADTAFLQTLPDLCGNVDKAPPTGNIERQLLSK